LHLIYSDIYHAVRNIQYHEYLLKISLTIFI
jgi:hypothetical protein